MVYTGTMIEELMQAVEREERRTAEQPNESGLDAAADGESSFVVYSAEDHSANDFEMCYGAA
jgi:hypothetical protein